MTAIDKSSYEVSIIETGEGPLKLCRAGESVYVICSADNTLREVAEESRRHKLPHKAVPDNLFEWNGQLVITSHNSEKLYIDRFDPAKRRFTTVLEMEYPYGNTRFDTRNVSFYVRGQYGDAVFEITRAETDTEGRLWVTDFLSGKLFILE